MCRIHKVQVRAQARAVFQSFADLVVIAKEFYPIPFRTRPSKPSASMVLRLKPRESRTLPGLPRTEVNPLCASAHGERTRPNNSENPGHESDRGFCFCARLSRPRVALGRAPRSYAAAMNRSSLSQVHWTCSSAFGGRSSMTGCTAVATRPPVGRRALLDDRGATPAR